MSTQIVDTTDQRVDEIVAAAAAAARPFAEWEPRRRAELLRSLSSTLDAAAEELVPLAAGETALPEQRLRGELLRTVVQLEHFAEVLEEGSFLEVIIDMPDPSAKPAPRPDLRRMLVPVGPVLVFAASNFPFAFSVAGGDTAAALAAGCPVILKAHPGHLRLSERTGQLVRQSAHDAGAPEGVFNVVFGNEAGKRALLSAKVKAGAFTGSTHAGRLLFDLAAGRDEPIPFYGELGSLNPVFVTNSALERRGDQIVSGYVESFTLGVGQFCTKPGLLFVPKGHGLDNKLIEAAEEVAPGPMLNERIHSGHQTELERLCGYPDVHRLLAAPAQDGPLAGPTLLQTTVPELLAHQEELLTECFGPTSFVVEYADEKELLDAAAAFTGQLTATVHAEEDETEKLGALLDLLEDRAGRVIWNGWPTGVAVAWAMQHGGPYPATTTPLYTSVGGTSIRRFLRPVCYQSTPPRLLPAALRDENPLRLPRRVNGRLQLGRDA